MCFQTVPSIRQRCERPVTIPLHLRRRTAVYKSLGPFLPHAPRPSRSSPEMAAQQALPQEPDLYPPVASCSAAAAGPRPGIKKRAGEALRLFSMPGLCCRDPVSAGRASGHPCKCAGPSGGHTSCSPRGPHARGHLPCWYAGTSRPRRGRTRAICHGYASLHR